MAQTSLEILGAMLHAMLVTVTWGDSNVARYARATSDVISNGQTFTAAPSLKITFDKAQQGGVEDSEVQLAIAMRHTPFDDLASAYVHATVKVVIEEIIPGDDASRQEVFTGIVGRVTARPSSTDGIAKCMIMGIKRRLDAPLGVQAITTCNWQFGNHNGSPCGLDIDAISVPGTIIPNFDGIATRVLFDPTGAAPDYANIRWNRGYIKVDGLYLTIRESIGSGFFNLRRIPPPGIIGVAAVLVPGCDKQISTCRYWDRESQFGGFGYALPRYNPILAEG